MSAHTPADDAVTMADLLVELKAIRALLDQQGVCPHGNSGICMYCIQPTFDAIEMSVRSAVQR